MSHKLTLELPDEVYAPLAETAAQVGASPEQLAVEWLAAQGRGVSDPIEPFIGAIRTDVPNWADRHDELLGAALAAQRLGKEPKPDA
jgi:hypothetical protein